MMSITDMMEEWKHSSEYWEDRANRAEAELDRLREENADLRSAGEEMVSWFRVNGGRGPIQIARIEAILAKQVGQPVGSAQESLDLNDFSGA